MATLSFWVMMMSSKQSKMKWVSPSHIFFHFLSPFLFFYFWGIKYRECLKGSIQKLHLYNNSEVEILLSFGLLLPTPISRILFQSLLLWVYDLMFMCTCPQIYIYMHAHTHSRFSSHVITQCHHNFRDPGSRRTSQCETGQETSSSIKLFYSQKKINNNHTKRK